MNTRTHTFTNPKTNTTHAKVMDTPKMHEHNTYTHSYKTKGNEHTQTNIPKTKTKPQ